MNRCAKLVKKHVLLDFFGNFVLQKHIIQAMKRKTLLIASLLLLVLSSYAAKVDTLLVKSPSMNKDIKVIVVTPDIAMERNAIACPVVYLLHGFGGNEKNWILMAVKAGIGTARSTRTVVMRHLSLRN